MKSSGKLSLSLILLFCYTLYPQAQSRLNWTTDSEALPQNSIKSIAPDKYGYIWMSTENGLVRYDGKEFNVYDNNNIGIKNNRIIQIQGNYMSDTLYTTNEFHEDYILINNRTAQKAKSPESSSAFGFKIRNDGSFISSGSPNILYDVPKRPYIIPLVSGNYFYIKNDQIRFFNSRDKLQYTLDFAYDSNSNFFAFGDSLFYLKKNSEYAIINNGKVHWNRLNLNMNKKSMLYWNIVSRQVFIYSENKLYSINYNKKLNAAILIENEDLLANNVNCVYYDNRSKIVYLGSIKKGLGIYRIKTFTSITPDKSGDPELYEIFYALHPFTDSTAISASGIIMTNTKIIRNLNFISDKFSIAVDPDKNIWVKRGKTLYNYLKVDGYKNPRHWDFPEEISTLYLEKSGNIWFGLTNNIYSKGSIWYFKPTANPSFHKFQNVNFKVNYFSQLNTTTLWIGSSKGLHKIDMNHKKLYSYPATKSIKIRNLYFTDENNIWLTSYEKGFHLLRNNHLCTFPMDKNAFLRSSHSIVEDKKGYFWIATNKGLFQIKKNALIDYADKKTKTIYYHYYNKEFGFLSNEFNGGSQPNGITLKNGTIFFPSINGVVTFNPDSINPVLPEREIYIDQVVVDGKKSLINNDTLNLDRHFDRITFYIESPYYGNQGNLNFEVKLEGPNPQDWINVPKEQNISFSKLSPGTYTLTTRKLNGFDGNYSYKRIVLFVKPAFWQTASFSILLLFFSFLLLFLLYSLRVKYITNKNKQLQKAVDEKTKDLKMTINTLLDTKASLNGHIENNTKIIQYITHDIKSPLKFMAMTTQRLYDSDGTDKKHLKENLKDLFTSSTQMYNFVDNLLEYSKIYNAKGETDIIPSYVSTIIDTKIGLFQNIAKYQKTIIVNMVPKNYLIRINKQPLSIAMHNLLDNAVKNTYSGKIIFLSYTDNSGTHIEIKDNGNGMNQETLEYYRAIIRNYNPGTAKNSLRLGLQIVIELILTWGGTVTIDSCMEKGTTVTLTFSNSTLLSEL